MQRSELTGMLRDWFFAFGVASVLMLGWKAVQRAPAADGAAPPLELTATTGGEWDLHSQEAPAYVVNFWATWCGPCKAEIPEFSRFAAAHPEVQVLGVSVDQNMATGRLASEARRLGIDYLVLHDPLGAAASDWGVSVYPTTFVLDRHRNIVATRVGQVDRVRLEEMLPSMR